MFNNFEMTVTNIKGQQEPVDFNKITEQVRQAIDRFISLKGNRIYLKPERVTSKASFELEPGISTSEISNVVVNTAKNLATLDEPAWLHVAGIIYMQRLRKQRKCYDLPFDTWVQKMVDQGLYRPDLLSIYSQQDLKKFQNQLNFKRDFLFDHGGVSALEKRYLLDDELPQYLFAATALSLSIPEYEKDRLSFAKDLYDALSTLKISLATPLLRSARKPESNTASCFIIDVEDSLEGLMKANKDTALISRNAGGLGIYLGRVRSAGSTVKGHKGASKGVIAQIQVLDPIIRQYDQLGQRKGAATVALPVWHRDLPQFLQLQTVAGDDRLKAHDIKPQITVPDIYVEQVKTDKDWYLFDPKECLNHGIDLNDCWGEEFNKRYLAAIALAENGDLELFTKLSAKDLFKDIILTILSTGMPYIFMMDAANRANPNKGWIPAGNLCQESWSSLDHDHFHTCNLASIVAPNIETDEQLRQVSAIAIRALNNSIDIGNLPIPEARAHNLKYRTLGLGLMGLQDYLALKKEIYGSDRSKELLHELIETISFAALRESCLIAKDKKRFPAFNESNFALKDPIYCGRSFAELAGLSANPRNNWLELEAMIKEWGVANSQVMAIAPTTSTSILMGVSPGVIPVKDLQYSQQNMIGNLKSLPPAIEFQREYYVPITSVPDQDLLDMIAIMQAYVDSGVSVDLTYDLTTKKPGDLARYYLRGMEMGLKSFYYCRSKMNDNNRDDTEKDISAVQACTISNPDCEACAG